MPNGPGTGSTLLPRAAGPVELVVLPDAARRSLRWLGWTVAVLTALALVAAAVLVGSAQLGGSRSGPAATGVGPADRTSALLLSGSSLSYVDAQATAEALQWDTAVYALPGAGFSRSTLDPAESITGTTRQLLPSPDRTPDVVVIQGGEADHAAAPETLQRATEHLVDYVRAHAGAEAQLVLVGPIPGETVPGSMTRVNDVLRAVAEQRGVPYVDALALGLRAGDPALSAGLADALAAATG